MTDNVEVTEAAKPERVVIPRDIKPVRLQNMYIYGNEAGMIRKFALMWGLKPAHVAKQMLIEGVYVYAQRFSVTGKGSYEWRPRRKRRTRKTSGQLPDSGAGHGDRPDDTNTQGKTA